MNTITNAAKDKALREAFFKRLEDTIKPNKNGRRKGKCVRVEFFVDEKGSLIGWSEPTETTLEITPYKN